MPELCYMRRALLRAISLTLRGERPMLKLCKEAATDGHAVTSG